MNRREFVAGAGGVVLASSTAGMALGSPAAGTAGGGAESAPIRQKRPAWVEQEGLVMAGVDWEPLLPRLRAGSFDLSEVHMDYQQKMAFWRSEHSEEVARRLKSMGYNFLMIPLYKGGGLKAERTSMQDAKQFAAICHRLGLHVGCYTFSGTVLYEPMLAEDPTATEWFTMDHNGRYVPYGSLYFRRFINRSLPGFRALARKLVDFAVTEVHADLVHFDNYTTGPAYEAFSVTQFRQYLEKKYTPQQRRHRFGFQETGYIVPPPAAPHVDQYNGDPLYRDFIDYRCQVMADTYQELGEYARSLNPEVIVELNPGGYRGELASSLGIGAVDHTRTIQWGGAFWDEGYPSRFEDGLLRSRFRSYMLGRHFGNMVFDYTAGRAAIAESMAHNLQCLGCPAWVSGTEIIPYLAKGGRKQFEPEVVASIQFFHRYQQYYRDATPVADVGVINTYANTAYGPQATRNVWAAVTQALYQAKIPFDLVPDREPGDLSRFRALVVPDVALISDSFLDTILQYVKQGGALVATGRAASFDEQGFRRAEDGFKGLFSGQPTGKVVQSAQGRAIYVPQIQMPSPFKIGMQPENKAELLDAVHRVAGSPLAVHIEAPETVAMGLYSQAGGRRILHLVNYDEQTPSKNLEVTMAVGTAQVRSVLSLTPGVESSVNLSYKQDGKLVRFTVPELKIYNLLVVE